MFLKVVFPQDVSYIYILSCIFCIVEQLYLFSSIIYYVGMLFITDAVFFLYRNNTSEDNKL